MDNISQKSFINSYNAYCNENKVKSKLHLADNQLLKINADRLEKDDWTPILRALENNSHDLHSVIIQSHHMRKCEKLVKAKGNTVNSNEPAFLREPLLKMVVESVGKCAVNSRVLCNLCLDGFPLNNTLIEILDNSIKLQPCLQYLGLPNCTLSDNDLSCLCKTISMHTGLHTIDFSNCGITQNGAKQLSDVIKSQKLVRYGETWKQSLRYRSPQPDIVPGLRRLTLNNNTKLGDEGFKLICHELLDDLWIKAVDFQNCAITSKSGVYAIDLVKTNPVIKILDLRRNSIPEKIIKEICKVLKTGNYSGNDDSTYDWLDSTASSSNTSLLSKPKSQNNVQLTQSNTFHSRSSPNMKIASSPNQAHTPVDKTNNKKVTNEVIDELERTKSILHKVSSRLFEEKSKREAIEKQHLELKDQIEKIRSCLKQHVKTNRSQAPTVKNDVSYTTSYISSKSSDTSQNYKKLPNRNLENLKKSNKKNSIIKKKKITNKSCNNESLKSSDSLANHSLKSTKLFLYTKSTKYKNLNSCTDVVDNKIVQLKSQKVLKK